MGNSSSTFAAATVFGGARDVGRIVLRYIAAKVIATTAIATMMQVICQFFHFPQTLGTMSKQYQSAATGQTRKFFSSAQKHQSSQLRWLVKDVEFDLRNTPLHNS